VSRSITSTTYKLVYQHKTVDHLIHTDKRHQLNYLEKASDAVWPLGNTVGFLPQQKVFLPGQREKTVKTTVKTGKNWH